MKKMTAVLLSVLMVMALAACGGEKESTKERTSDTGNTTEAASAETDLAENTLPETAAEAEQNESTPETAADNGQTEETGESEAASEEEGRKILVVYFSATDTTKGVAEIIADSLSADIYEIVPEQPYTDADLDYNDDNSRCTVEMNDSSARPAISGSVEDMEQYEVVLIGYPIWFGQAPRIIGTFLESYDFSGKLMVPFCTSHSSGIGSSADNLHALCSDSTEWLEGKRFEAGASKETIEEWLKNSGINE